MNGNYLPWVLPLPMFFTAKAGTVPEVINPYKTV
jgi:hypothetical protein